MRFLNLKGFGDYVNFERDIVLHRLFQTIITKCTNANGINVLSSLLNVCRDKNDDSITSLAELERVLTACGDQMFATSDIVTMDVAYKSVSEQIELGTFAWLNAKKLIDRPIEKLVINTLYYTVSSATFGSDLSLEFGKVYGRLINIYAGNAVSIGIMMPSFSLDIMIIQEIILTFIGVKQVDMNEVVKFMRLYLVNESMPVSERNKDSVLPYNALAFIEAVNYYVAKYDEMSLVGVCRELYEKNSKRQSFIHDLVSTRWDTELAVHDSDLVVKFLNELYNYIKEGKEYEVNDLYTLFNNVWNNIA